MIQCQQFDDVMWTCFILVRFMSLWTAEDVKMREAVYKNSSLCEIIH